MIKFQLRECKAGPKYKPWRRVRSEALRSWAGAEAGGVEGIRGEQFLCVTKTSQCERMHVPLLAGCCFAHFTLKTSPFPFLFSLWAPSLCSVVFRMSTFSSFAGFAKHLQLFLKVNFIVTTMWMHALACRWHVNPLSSLRIQTLWHCGFSPSTCSNIWLVVNVHCPWSWWTHTH